MLVLRYFEDLPESQVALLLGCSVGTVRRATRRSRVRLRALAASSRPGNARPDLRGDGVA